MPTFFQLLGWLALHGIGALLIRQFAILATIHAVGVLLVGLRWAIRRPLEDLIYVAAYLVACEAIWRSSDAWVLHEYCKYGLVLILGTGLIRRRKSMPAIPVIYFLLLLPSIGLTVTSTNLDNARQAVSGALSGPLAIAVAFWYFWNIRVTRDQVMKTLILVVLPIFGLAVTAIVSTLTADEIRFQTESMDVTSGGWGANQVSSALAFGAVAAFFLSLNTWRQRGVKIIFLLLFAQFLVQAAMTFSRGGPYLIVISTGLALFFIVRVARARFTVLVFLLAFLGLMNSYLLPKLDEFTGGKFTERVFEDVQGSGREDILMSDLQFWQDNPVFGIGPGMGRYLRARLYMTDQRDHTEYSRMLAEHGLFGMLALALMLFLPILAFFRTKSSWQKAFVVALMSWAYAYMLVNSMRLTAPAFLLGLAFVRFWPPGTPTRMPPAKGRKRQVSRTWSNG